MEEDPCRLFRFRYLKKGRLTTARHSGWSSQRYAEILNPGRLQASAKLSLLNDQQEMLDAFASSEAERYLLDKKGTSH